MRRERRVRVTIACAVSLDGKISTAARAPVTFTSRRDRARLHALRDATDAILVGAATLRAEDPPLLPSPERARAREARGLRPFPARVVLSRSLELPSGRALEPREGAPVHLFTTSRSPERKRRALRARGITVHSTGEEIDPARVLEALSREEGVARVLCEGGGTTNATFLEAGLVDELELTVVPVVIGGALAPTLVDGEGFASGRFPRAELVAHEVTPEGELFLSYRFRR